MKVRINILAGVMLAGSLNAQDAIRWERAAYVSPAMKTEAISFALPGGVSAGGVESVVYDDRHGQHPAHRLWRIDGETIQFSPVGEWAIGINLMQLRLNSGKEYRIIIAGLGRTGSRDNTYNIFSFCLSLVYLAL